MASGGLGVVSGGLRRFHGRFKRFSWNLMRFHEVSEGFRGVAVVLREILVFYFHEFCRFLVHALPGLSFRRFQRQFLGWFKRFRGISMKVFLMRSSRDFDVHINQI